MFKFVDYPPEYLTAILQTISKEAISKNAVFIFGTCYGEKCINSQVLSNTLQSSVYTSSKITYYELSRSPPIMYGDFNKYEPQKSDSVKK